MTSRPVQTIASDDEDEDEDERCRRESLGL